MSYFWKCRHCHGTGKQIVIGKVIPCDGCDGTGNGFVDGREEAHKRRIAEAESAAPEHGETK